MTDYGQGSRDREFVSNLEHLKKLVNDEVTHHDADQLLIAIGDKAKSGEKHMAIAIGDF